MNQDNAAAEAAQAVEAPYAARLDRLRHSAAHVMAQAVVELYPGTRLAIGPAIENGFYYDFDSPHRFTLEDLPAIEARMREIAAAGHEFKAGELPYDEALKFWKERSEPYKVELVEGLKGQAISHYTHGPFTDLCRGGHCRSTAELEHFKLLSVAGAYWRGSERNPMLQRIYGTAWASAAELDAHLRRLEEAKKRDHRRLGADLDIFSVHEEAGAGLIHWHPKGAMLRHLLETYLRRILEDEGYEFVCTPHIASEAVYRLSGHLQHYADLMYAPMDIEGQPFRAKPMNCPNHIMIYRARLRSYRDLPVKYAEFATVYRFEKSGVLHGLLRVRGFTQDDAHIFCREDQIKGQLSALLALARRVYKDFGFTDARCYLSTHGNLDDLEGGFKDPAVWERAEETCRQALKEADIPFGLEPGGAAFYGPKIDFKVRDALGREHQLCTIQLDFNLPQRFNATYRTAAGGEERVAIIHRAILGSLERFIGILIEHFAGVFPLWLAPVQVKVLTINEDVEPKARELAALLREAGLRPGLDARPEKIGHKIRDATLERVPYMVVLGPKDVAAGTVNVRLHSGRQVNGLRPGDLAARLAEEAREMRLSSVFEAA